MKRNFFLPSALSVAFLCSCVFAQDPSLGDVARKQRKANASTATPHASHVVTNDDLPQKMVLTTNKPAQQNTMGQYYINGSGGNADQRNQQAKYLQDAIRERKETIAELKTQLADLQKEAGQADQSSAQSPNGQASRSGSCAYSGLYREACDNARQLQREIDSTKAEIDAAEKDLEQLQEQVRKMGFGNSVYDPD